MHTSSRHFVHLCATAVLLSCLQIVTGVTTGVITGAHAQNPGPFSILANISRFSAPPGGATPNGGSGSPAQSANGRYVTFSSTSSNLVSNDTNFSRDIFLRDLLTNATTRISVSSAGGQGDDYSDQPAISPVAPSGFFAVAFSSAASNLIPINDPFGNVNIFVRLPTSNVTYPVTYSTDGRFANGDSDNATVTILPEPNRILVAFESNATNLVSDDFSGWQDIFLHSMLQSEATGPNSGAFTRISKGVFGTEANGSSFGPRISGDGRFVVYASNATNLVSGVTVSGSQVYLYNIALGTNSLVSKSSDGTPANNDSYTPSINFDGSVITFSSDATNLVPGQGGTSKTRAYVYQATTSTISVANTSPTGADGDGTLIGGAEISADGRFVAFSDTSDNLTNNDANGVADLFARDLVTGFVGRVSTASDGGDADGSSDLPVISGDGYNALTGTISFRSNSSSITAGASGNPEIFGRQIQFAPRTISKGTVVSVPPDLRLDSKKVGVTAQKFSNFVQARGASTVARAAKPKIEYDFRLQRDGTKRDFRRTAATRNLVTFNRLPPGTYTASYRTLVKRGTKVVVKTPFSPSQRFSISQ